MPLGNFLFSQPLITLLLNTYNSIRTHTYSYTSKFKFKFLWKKQQYNNYNWDYSKIKPTWKTHLDTKNSLQQSQ